MIAAVSEVRAEVVSGIVGALISSSLESIQTIEEIRDNPDASDGDRLRAASTLLSEMRHVVATIELEHRLANVEAATAEIEKTRKTSRHER